MNEVKMNRVSVVVNMSYFVFFLFVMFIVTCLPASNAAAIETTIEYTCVTRHFGPNGFADSNPYNPDQFQLNRPKPCSTGFTFRLAGCCHDSGAISCTVKEGKETCTVKAKRNLYPLTDSALQNASLNRELTKEEQKLGCVLDEAASFAGLNCYEDLSQCELVAWYQYGCSKSPNPQRPKKSGK